MALVHKAIPAGGTIKKYLYKNGDQCSSLTGGWQSFTNYGTGGTANFNVDHIFLKGAPGGNNQKAISTKNKIQIEQYKRIGIKFTFDASSAFPVSFHAAANVKMSSGTNVLADANGADFRIAENFKSRIDGDVIAFFSVLTDAYIIINASNGAAYKIKEIWLEK